MSDFLRTFKHLLPTGRAWRLTSNKALRWFFEGLAGIGRDIKTHVDLVWLDIWPPNTRELDNWEQQFALYGSALSDDTRRTRLDAAWKALGGQDPHYIQKTLRDAGFDVYVHEWWQPGTEPEIGSHVCALPRNPRRYLKKRYTDVTLMVECGEPGAQCGEPWAIAGNSRNPRGYPLVNKVYVSEPGLIVLAGEAVAHSGEPEASAGNFYSYRDVLRDYYVPPDPSKWPYFLYIGGKEFGIIARVPHERKDELEALALKISPLQQWLGFLVEYY